MSARHLDQMIRTNLERSKSYSRILLPDVQESLEQVPIKQGKNRKAKKNYIYDKKIKGRCLIVAKVLYAQT